MKISILLPYKENFSPEYPGAVSIFLNSVIKRSKYKKYITVYGSTSFKNKYEIQPQTHTRGLQSTTFCKSALATVKTPIRNL